MYRFIAITTIFASVFFQMTLGSAQAENSVRVEQAWARASILETLPAAAYLTIENDGAETIRLIGLETPIAARAEIHESKNDAGVMRMEPAGPLTIPPGDSVILKPGGLHVMLMKLNEPLVRGKSLTLTLHFDGGRSIDVSVPIVAPGANGPEQ